MSIADRLGNKSEAWVAEEGDQLTGTVISLGELEGDYGPYPTVEIRDEDGKYWMWHAFDTVAKNELARQKPSIGDAIGIAYLGVKKTKPGSKYDSFKDWQVIVEKATGPVTTPNWDEHAAAAADEGVNDFAPFPDDDDVEPF